MIKMGKMGKMVKMRKVGKISKMVTMAKKIGRKGMNIKHLGTVALTFIGLTSWVQAATTSAALPRLMRPLGMGGAYVGLADDENAMFHNPAGLAFSEQKWSFNITPLMLDTSQKTVEFAGWLANNLSRLGSDFTQWTQSDLDKFSDANVRLGYNANVTLLLPPTAFGFPFAAGAYGNLKSNFNLSQVGLIPEVIIDSTIDVVVPVSIAQKLFIPALDQFFDTALGGGRLGVGVTGKFIQRFAFEERRSALELSSFGHITDKLSDAIKNPKTGMGFDVGVMYGLPWGLSFGLAAQDIATTIGGDSVPMKLNFGVAYRAGDFSFGPFNEWVFAFDVDSINDGEVTFFNKLHMGVETNLVGFLRLRGGLYQGYPGFGLAFNFFLFRLDYITHAVELGKFPGQLEDRQHTLALSIRL